MITVNEDFSVVDEGEGWIVVDKGAPLIVHPANGRSDEPTLLGGIERLLSYDLVNGARLSLINRLDRETSGLVLVATSKGVARELGRAMERREVKKIYDALVYGWPEWDEILVDAPILRQGEVMESSIYVKQMVHDGGRASVTRMRVVERVEVEGRRLSLLRVEPETGRMHQIRVHASHVGHAIVGDKIYGADEALYLRFIERGVLDDGMMEELLLPRHALHASGMGLVLGGVRCDWRIELAEDLRGLLDRGIQL